MDEVLLTVGEAARTIGVGTKTILRYVKKGLLTRVVVQDDPYPRRVKYKLSEVRARQKEAERGQG